MAHESGRVNSSREALVLVRLGGETMECVVDTGFDGGLMLPGTLIESLQIPIIGELVFEMVGGARMTAEVGLGEIEWLGKLRTVELIGSKGNDALIGTELLTSTTLNIDYIASTVRITTSVESM